MIRVLVFLVVVCALALGFAWLADRPGDVAITWLGRRIETSVMVAITAIGAIAVATVALWSLVSLLLGSPAAMANAARRRRRQRGRQAVASGLVAIASGDARAAQKFTAEAERTAPGEPLALLLRAQTAQLTGDRAGADEAFREMAARADTKLLGLRGLYVEAQRRDDTAAAQDFAEAAARAAPALPWAGQAVLDFRCASGDWEGALAVLDGHLRNGLIDKATHRRQRAVLLTGRALAVEETDRPLATTLAVEATRLASDLVPAAALAGRLLADAGEPRKAGKILEAAWRNSPHPDLADIYAHIRISDSARDRLTRVQALVRQPAGHAEGALALARAALDAREFVLARLMLTPLADDPTQRVCLLMAELEELEHGDAGRAREWMARAMRAHRDPAWTADGFVSDRWMPVSPVTGRLDAFEWRVPVAELGGPVGPTMVEHRPAIEVKPAPEPLPPEPEPEPPPVVSAPAAASPPPIVTPPPEPLDALPPPPPPAAPTRSAISSRREARDEPRHEPPVGTIIPLVPAPDDPGPEAEREIVPDEAPRQNGWRRWFR